MTEELVSDIDEGFAESELPDRYKLAIKLTDVIISDPRGMTSDLAAEANKEMSPAEVMELLLTTALASAFSKAAIAWGPPPGMPTLEVPTPRRGASVG